jgi:hypothetical protein
MMMIRLADNKKAVQYARKYAVEHRVRLCEEHLQTLRQELLNADRDIEEVNSCIEMLRNLVPPPVNISPNLEGTSLGYPSSTLYHSDDSASDDSASDESASTSSGHCD